MSECVVNWKLKPFPWSQIGPRFKAECEAIMAGAVLPAAPRASTDRRLLPRSSPSDLRRRRMALGLTQQQLAEAVGVKRRNIIDHELGRLGDHRRIEAALRRLEAQR